VKRREKEKEEEKSNSIFVSVYCTIVLKTIFDDRKEEESG